MRINVQNCIMFDLFLKKSFLMRFLQKKSTDSAIFSIHNTLSKV